MLWYYWKVPTKWLFHSKTKLNSCQILREWKNSTIGIPISLRSLSPIYFNAVMSTYDQMNQVLNDFCLCISQSPLYTDYILNHHNRSILLSQKSHHWLILSIQNMGRSNIHHRKTFPQEIFLSKDWIDAGYLPLQPEKECYISPNQAIATS